jgi:peptidoglycan hydrolase CwlO-like protein
MPKDKKPIEDVPEEENVITPEEFEALEKKEKKGKRSFFSKDKPKEPPQPPARGPENRGGEDDLFVAVEKIQAKLETIEGLRQATEEKISRISEEIGELRSSILEKDKTFNQVESGFEKVKEIFQELQPKKIRADLDKKEDEIEKINAKVESFDTKIADMKKKMDDVVTIMEKIKDLKNVIAISETISKKMAKIEDDRKETTKVAAKVESMFSEITEKMSEFHNYRDKIEFSSESMHDMMKSMDMLEVKVENAFTKDDAKKIDDRIEQLETDLTDKIQLVRDIVDDLVTSLKKGGVKDLLKEAGKTRMDEMNKKFSDIENYEKSLKEVSDQLAKLREEKNKEVGSLISEVEKLKQEKPATIFKKEAPAASVPGSKKKKDSVKPAQPPLIQPQQEEEKPLEYAEPEAQDINYLIEQCHTNVDKGSIEEARKLYGQIISVYEQTKDSPGGEQLYGRIKRLYYRLQIYA